MAPQSHLHDCIFFRGDCDPLLTTPAPLLNHTQHTEVFHILCERTLDPLMPGFNVEAFHMLPVTVLCSIPLFLRLCLVISQHAFSFVAVYCVTAVSFPGRTC
jgi:hypothetical protein